jgi:hypothetical protein
MFGLLRVVQCCATMCDVKRPGILQIGLFLILERHLTTAQGCQMVCFQTKNPNLGKFCRALDWQMLIYFMAIRNILWRLDIFYDHLETFCIHLVHFSGYGIMYQEKSGNPG